MFTIRPHYHQLKSVICFKAQYHHGQHKGTMASIKNRSNQFSAAQSEVPAALSSFELHGYHPPPNLSDDLTYMDIVLLITRRANLRQGSMGCILVRPLLKTTTADGEEMNNPQQNELLSRIIAAANNTSLFQPDDSDVHAEINAIGQVSKRIHSSLPHNTPSTNIISTQGATAYITMPPCKRCFGALYAAGIKRIVSRKQHPDILLKAASEVGIEMSCLTHEEMVSQYVRMDKLFADGSQHKKLDEGNNAEEIVRRRKHRKDEKRARKMAKIAQDNMDGNTSDGG